MSTVSSVGRHYVLHVVSGSGLNAANKRAIKNAVGTHGTTHLNWGDARRAAVGISRVGAVRHVAVERVEGRGIFMAGKRVK